MRVDQLVHVPLSGPQWDALVSYLYNEGPKQLQQPGFLPRLNGGDYGKFEDLMRRSADRHHGLAGVVQRRRLELARWQRSDQGPSEFCPAG